MPSKNKRKVELVEPESESDFKYGPRPDSGTESGSEYNSTIDCEELESGDEEVCLGYEPDKAADDDEILYVGLNRTKLQTPSRKKNPPRRSKLEAIATPTTPAAPATLPASARPAMPATTVATAPLSQPTAGPSTMDRGLVPSANACLRKCTGKRMNGGPK